MPHWRALGAVSLGLLTGCVRLPPPPGQCVVATAWSTAYARQHILATLAPGQIRVLHYTVIANPARGRPCGTITLHKQLAVMRGRGDLHIAEVRDFYHGHLLVAVHTAHIGARLSSSGRYTSDVTLPIPGNAPLGHYTVISLLYARWGDGPPILLARSRTHFLVTR
ncbi:MAG: hypothetical protein M0Z76_03915 [Gammaproteobacteria bacterium]|nr:hypothetical protein [Gammaproteobacteria bacterium]